MATFVIWVVKLMLMKEYHYPSHKQYSTKPHPQPNRYWRKNASQFWIKRIDFLLSTYGIYVSYDTVLGFRHSGAYYAGNQEILFANLRHNGGQISALPQYIQAKWNTRDPFSCIQFSQSDNTDGTCVNDPSDLMIIPRLSKHEVKNLKLSELNPVNIVHFYGQEETNSFLLKCNKKRDGV